MIKYRQPFVDPPLPDIASSSYVPSPPVFTPSRKRQRLDRVPPQRASAAWQNASLPNLNLHPNYQDKSQAVTEIFGREMMDTMWV